jgi:hypothetical protein
MELEGRASRTELVKRVAIPKNCPDNKIKKTATTEFLYKLLSLKFLTNDQHFPLLNPNMSIQGSFDVI